MPHQSTLALLTTDLQDRVTAVVREVQVLSAAVTAWREAVASDRDALIAFSYGRIKKLIGSLRVVLADLVAIEDEALEGLIHSLRQGVRGAATLLARPERLLPTLPREAAKFAETGGRGELINLP